MVGSGAAGLNAADRLCSVWSPGSGARDREYESGEPRVIQAPISRRTMSCTLAGDAPDSVRKLAQVLYDGGCVDGEHALCEAALSCQGFFKLVELGVPFPHNVYGEYVGYKTDHDPNDRGTSVGPYTSRYMTEKLEQAVREKEDRDPGSSSGDPHLK